MSFEEWFKEQVRVLYKDDKWIAEKAWDARQGEIENSYKIGYQDGFNSRQQEVDSFERGYIDRKNERDEMQKRIDGALNVFKSDLSEIGKFDTIHKILKGELK